MAAIFSIGYGNRSITLFLNLLTGYGIDILIDIRSYPYSRFNAHYNGAVLSALLENNGIRYLYMGDVLGEKPKDKSLYINGKLDHNAINCSATYKATLNNVIKLADQKNLCLMCCELHPENCHRKN